MENREYINLMEKYKYKYNDETDYYMATTVSNIMMIKKNAAETSMVWSSDSRIGAEFRDVLSDLYIKNVNEFEVYKLHDKKSGGNVFFYLRVIGDAGMIVIRFNEK
jgi:hypothetical protein